MDCFGVDDGSFFVCMEDSDMIIPAGKIQNWLGVLSQFYVIKLDQPGSSLKDEWQILEKK